MKGVKWTSYNEYDPNTLIIYKKYMKDPTAWEETCYKWNSEDIYIQTSTHDDIPVGFMTAFISHQNETIYINEFCTTINESYINRLMTEHTDALQIFNYDLQYQNVHVMTD
jgi:hypothetical protein